MGHPGWNTYISWGVLGTAGIVATTSGARRNGIGLPDVGPGCAAGRFLFVPLQAAGAQREGRVADAQPSQQHQEGLHTGPIEHETELWCASSPGIGQKVRASGARSGSCTGDALLDPNSSLIVGVRPTYPSREDGATPQTGVSVSRIPAIAEYSNSDVVSNFVQNSAAVDGDLVSSDFIISNSTQNSGGLRQTDAVINCNVNEDNAISGLSILHTNPAVRPQLSGPPTGKLCPFENSDILVQNLESRTETLGLGELVDFGARGQDTSHVGRGEGLRSGARGQNSSNERGGPQYFEDPAQDASVDLRKI